MPPTILCVCKTAESFYDPELDAPPADPGICEDLHEKCGTWAAENECNLNPSYMVRTQFTTSPGSVIVL